MKTKRNYIPKYSLSIKILKAVLGKEQTKEIIKKYVAYKKENWGSYGK